MRGVEPKDCPVCHEKNGLKCIGYDIVTPEIIKDDDGNITGFIVARTIWK